MSKKFKEELPENYAELKKVANYTSSWRDRLGAVKELAGFKHEKVIDLLTNRMQNDTVYNVQEAAYEALANFGESVEKPARHRFDLIKGTDKIFLRVKKSLAAGHTVEDFADKLKRTRLDVYDAYEGDKGENFMTWLEEKWSKINK
ncbi:MAG: HEAT repeat domain-containing protein [Lysinibacillus sp.]